jgi:hypothetical protein
MIAFLKVKKIDLLSSSTPWCYRNKDNLSSLDAQLKFT